MDVCVCVYIPGIKLTKCFSVYNGIYNDFILTYIIYKMW